MRSTRVIRLVKMSLLAALSIVLVFVSHFSIFPSAPFLEYDMADIPILIGTFMFGPWHGLILTAAVSLLQWLLISPQSGWVGAVMHLFATGAFAIVAGLIYQRRHTIKGAVIALLCGSLAMIIAMIPKNIFISPFFVMLMMGYESYSEAQSFYVDNFLLISFAFNIVKALGNALLTFLLYKSAGKALNLIGRGKTPV